MLFFASKQSVLLADNIYLTLSTQSFITDDHHGMVALILSEIASHFVTTAISMLDMVETGVQSIPFLVKIFHISTVK